MPPNLYKNNLYVEEKAKFSVRCRWCRRKKPFLHLFWVSCIFERQTVKKRLAIFPSLVGMSLTKLSLAGNNETIPRQGKFG